MSKETIKRIVLGLLLVLLIYIWWDAIAVFSTGETPVAINLTPIDSKAKETSEKVSIEYRPPKINPFARAAKIKPTPKRAKTGSRSLTPTLSETHQLTGILRRGKLSQAVIELPSGTSAILSLGDTISEWRLHKIHKELVIFKKDKRFDSLFLHKSQ